MPELLTELPSAENGGLVVDESSDCSDGVDNDSDGWIDFDDPDCVFVGDEVGP